MAISSILIIFVVTLSIGISATLISVSDLQLAQAKDEATDSRLNVESCIENALMELNKNATIPTSLTTPQGTCQITLDSQSGSTWIFTVRSTSGDYQKTIRVSADRSGQVSINSWKEL